MMIAERQLNLRDGDVVRSVAVRMFSPERDESAWICRYEIAWPEGSRRSFAAGIDAVQALHLALQKIGLDLYMSEHHSSGLLEWNEPNEGYGFPVPKNGRQFLIGIDKEFDG